MSNFVQRSVILLALILLTGIITFIFNDDSFARIQRDDVIRIGYAVEAPYVFFTPEGIITGESPEVAKKIVHRLGIGRIEWIQSEFNSLITDLDSDRFDVIAAGMFVTKERAQLVQFSHPSFRVQQSLLVASGNPKNIHSYADAASAPGCKVAVIAGAIEEDILLGEGMQKALLLAVPDALSGRVALETGLVDAVALSSPSIHWMKLEDNLGKTEIAAPFTQPEFSGRFRSGFGAYAFRKNDIALAEKWDEAMREFIGTKEHLKLIQQFGFSAYNLPGATAMADIITK